MVTLCVFKGELQTDMKDYYDPIPKGCLMTKGFMSDPKTIHVFCIGSIVLLVQPVGEKYQY